MRSATRQSFAAYWAALVCLLGTAHQSPAQPCAVDSSFNAALNAGAQVYVVTLQANGQILIGGSFFAVGSVAVANVARLNPDGSLDTTFNPSTAANQGYVNAIALQNDGKVLIGGVFSSSSGAAPANLTRLNADGSVDESFDPTLSIFALDGEAAVNAIVVQPDGKILFGGNFSHVHSMPRRDIARLNGDGTLDLTFDACVAASSGNGATALAVLSNGKILASGNFTFSNGTVLRNGIARLNVCGDLDSTYAPQPGINAGTAYTLALQSSGKVLLAGNFQAYHNTLRQGIVQLTTSGTVDTGFDPGTGIGIGPTIYTVALQSDGKIIIGGDFTSYNEQTIYGVARLNPNGALDTACNPGFGPDNSVSSFAIQKDGRILVAGKFASFNNVPRNALVRLDGDRSRLSPTGLANGQLHLLFYGRTQVQYTVQSSSDLAHWDLVTNFTASSTPMALVDPTANLSSNRFYRVFSTAP